MYTVLHVDKSWIVCTNQGRLIIFDRKSLAVQAAYAAEEILREAEDKVSGTADSGRAA